MANSPRSRRFFKITMLCLLASWSSAAPEKLSAGQKAPVYARSSGGGNLAAPPPPGQTPANVGRLKPSGSQPGPKAASAPREEDAQKDETVSFKEVNGESVRVVSGNYGYQSPEGLPVSFKYTADENGSQASFSIGTAAAGGGGGGGKGGGGGGKGGGPPKGNGDGGKSAAPGAASKPGTGVGGQGQNRKGAPKESGKPTGAGPGGLPGNSDRKYLPPKM